MKSIRSKLIILVGAVVTTICIALGFLAYYNALNALNSNLEKTLPKISEQTAMYVSASLKENLSALETVASHDDISNPNQSWETKKALLQQQVERIGCMRISYVDANGNAQDTTDGQADVSSREFYQKAMQGVSNVSDPIVSKTDGSIVVIYAVPVYYNNNVVGALLETQDGNYLSELTNQVTIGDTGYAFMINKDGINIANTNQDLVTSMYNPIDAAVDDTSLQELADVETDMISGKSGVGEYRYEGMDKLVGYAPVPDTDWSVGVIVLKSEILSELHTLFVTVLISSILALLIGLAIVYVIAKSISTGIVGASKHLELLSEGDFSKPVNEKSLKAKDEIGKMANSMQTMQDSLSEMIAHIKENSSNINQQADNLSSVSEEIATVSEGVTHTISEIATGTSNQSSDLIGITELLDEFSKKLIAMVEDIQNADTSSREISILANQSTGEMSMLNQSVVHISDSFKEFVTKITELGQDINHINEITSLINNVAEQTNLLALNAAIEAARAGEAGKGFAVVADEIRNLSVQTQDASSNISTLITSISGNAKVIVTDASYMDKELSDQISIIENAISSFRNIIGSVEQVIPKIETAKNSAESINTDKDSIVLRVEALSAASEEVSASSEEISAASEEMNASTEEISAASQLLYNATNQMIDQVNKFKI